MVVWASAVNVATVTIWDPTVIAALVSFPFLSGCVPGSAYLMTKLLDTL